MGNRIIPSLCEINENRLVQNKSIKKTYVALLKGKLTKKRGRIESLIGRHHVDRKKMAVGDRNGKSAITHYEVMESNELNTLVKVNIETGRTHQIRVHMAYIGHPVVGDPLYGKKDKDIPLERQFLHSYEIHFNHPIIGKDMRFVSMLPRDLRAFLKELREKWKKK